MKTKKKANSLKNSAHSVEKDYGGYTVESKLDPWCDPTVASTTLAEPDGDTYEPWNKDQRPGGYDIPNRYDNPDPTPGGYTPIIIFTPSKYDNPDPTPNGYDSPDPSPSKYDNPDPSPGGYDSAYPFPVKYDNPDPTPGGYDSPDPSPSKYDNPDPNPTRIKYRSRVREPGVQKRKIRRKRGHGKKNRNDGKKKRKNGKKNRKHEKKNITL